MVIGSCPYDDCADDIWLPIAGQTPAFQRHQCEACQRWLWTYHSRIDPWSMPEDEFLQQYNVDEKTRTITRRA